MRDKDHIEKNWEQDFENLAWEEMRQKLDAEIPVETSSRNRKYSLMLLLLLWLGLGILGGGLLLFDTINVEEEQPPFSFATTIVVRESKEQCPENTNENELNEIPFEHRKAGPDENPIQEDMVDRKTEEKRQTLPPVLIPEKVLSTVNSQVINERIPDKMPYFEEEITKVNIASHPPAQREYVPLSPLEVLAPAHLDFVEVLPVRNMLLPSNEKAVKTDAPAYRPVSIYVHSGVHALPEMDFGGISGGINLNYALTKRFSLNAGLAYRWMRSRKMVGNTGSDVPNMHDASVELSADTMGILEQEGMIKWNNRHYLDLPITLSYHPHKKISLNAGIQLSYLLKSTENKLQEASHFMAFVPYPECDYRRVDLSGVFGLTYRPLPHLGLDLRYNYGALDFLKGSSERAHNRTLQFSVLYSFSR